MTKFCVVCGKSLTGNQRKLCSDKCRKVREKECAHEYYQNNPEKAKERSRKRYRNNPEKILEKRRKRYRNNPEKEKEQQRKYRLNNREKINESERKRYLNNREKIKKQRREQRQNNLEEKREYDYKQYRLSRGLPEDWDLSRESSIEVIMRRWLQESDIEFVQHHFINLENSTRTYVDFYFPEANVCLYCDGDYWHGPKRPDILERDARINRALETMGHIVIRLSESDILAGVRPVEILEMIQ